MEPQKQAPPQRLISTSVSANNYNLLQDIAAMAIEGVPKKPVSLYNDVEFRDEVIDEMTSDGIADSYQYRGHVLQDALSRHQQINEDGVIALQLSTEEAESACVLLNHARLALKDILVKEVPQADVDMLFDWLSILHDGFLGCLQEEQARTAAFAQTKEEHGPV